ncbi:hypothetical protein CHLNCDRAFT_144678 [Chlorella variabilis]|uniref:MYND-type domain-containing protein n=1 Tax=Chlorella variabilis TaxID=554065 RepID=E1ZCS5_CHLVA|nr:hypothetical protein CHLNCDRAFT_144678 [Chlorella variabilis]EFN56291.1 hypothetical protein CHLNCDRAFT_144678 [Chlorella variabilis]|eukprot:XP_005848393.1 hypothetical protein CHLNCDRAFT_144678 [Chlorella variabilis]
MEVALEKLQRSSEGMAPEEFTPELQALLGFASCMKDCEETLKGGLVQFVRAVALGAEAAGVGLCSAEVLTLLKERLLKASAGPIIRREEDGSYQAHRPSVVCPRPTPTNIVQLLVAGVFLHVTGNAEPAIAMLSAALSGVWPPAVETQRRLVARHFIPSVELEPAGQQREGGGSGGAADGVAASAAEAEEAGAAAGGGGSQVPAPESSAAGGQPPNEFAAALAEALKRHCPEVSAPDLQKSALVLRLFLGCRAVGQQAAAAQQPAARQQQQPPGGGGGSDALPGPGFQAIIRTLLLDCQQLLDLDPACMHAYVWAAQLALQARWPLEPARMAALLREGARRAADAQCWLAAAEVQHDHALWLMQGASAERNVAVRQTALLEAGQLLESIKEMEGRLAGWMPEGRLQQLTERRQQLAELQQQLRAGSLRGLGAARAGFAAAAACAFCGTPTQQLKSCAACKAVAYCSRACQVQDWKQGHKQLCGELAAAAVAGKQAPPAAVVGRQG